MLTRQTVRSNHPHMAFCCNAEHLESANSFCLFPFGSFLCLKCGNLYLLQLWSAVLRNDAWNGRRCFRPSVLLVPRSVRLTKPLTNGRCSFYTAKGYCSHFLILYLPFFYPTVTGAQCHLTLTHFKVLRVREKHVAWGNTSHLSDLVLTLWPREKHLY